MCEQRSWMRGRREAIAFGLGRPCGVRMQARDTCISFVAASHQLVKMPETQSFG